MDNKIERLKYLDYLRVLATIGVIMLHVAAQNWKVSDVNGFEWQVFNIFDCLVRWCVPIFVMISGVLFLNKDVPTKKIYSKYILRLVTAFIVWSGFYALITKGDIYVKITALIKGRFHMWYILMIIGLYILIPIIKQIIKDDRNTKYFLLIAFIFSFLIPSIIVIIKDFANGRVETFISNIEYVISKMELNMILGYTSYFILGYYLNKIDLSKKQRKIIYLVGFVGLLAIIVLTKVVSVKNQEPCSNYYSYFNINILFTSIAIFVLFKYKDWKDSKIFSLILKLSKYSFGVYLVHVFILSVLNNYFKLNSLSFNPILSILAITGITGIVSFIISAIMNNIPIIKKYIV